MCFLFLWCVSWDHQPMMGAWAFHQLSRPFWLPHGVLQTWAAGICNSRSPQNSQNLWTFVLHILAFQQDKQHGTSVVDDQSRYHWFMLVPTQLNHTKLIWNHLNPSRPFVYTYIYIYTYIFIILYIYVLFDEWHVINQHQPTIDETLTPSGSEQGAPSAQPRGVAATDAKFDQTQFGVGGQDVPRPRWAALPRKATCEIALRNIRRFMDIHT